MMNRHAVLVLVGAAMLALGAVAGRMLAPDAINRTESVADGERRVLYYRNPMGLPDTSPVPKKDSMGMDYIAVYADDDAGSSGGIALSPERIQSLGITSTPVALAPWTRSVRAVGRFEPAETALSTVTTKFEGWIERLHVDSVGQPVRAGDPLLAIYSPELVSTQHEYLVALQARRRLEGAREQALEGADALLRAAYDRLHNWDIGAAAIARLERTGEVRRSLVLHAPSSGVVLERNATVGMRAMPGERLFEIADLSRLWLIVDIFEQDLDVVTLGAEVSFEVTAEPGRTRTGVVDFVYPTMDVSTRTTRTRVLVDNVEGVLRPGMFATVTLTHDDPVPVMTVPDSAVLDTGRRQVVLVEHGNGRFEPRDVRRGRRASGQLEILSGLSPGERVVTRANFLIDAESNLRAATSGLASHGSHDEAPTKAATPPANGHEHEIDDSGTVRQTEDRSTTPQSEVEPEPEADEHDDHRGH